MKTKIFSILLALILVPALAFGASVTLSWDAPTTNTDNSPLTDLAGYRAFRADTSGTYCRAGNPPQYDFTSCDTTTMKEIGQPTQTVVFDNLNNGVHYFVVTAHNTGGNHSDYSMEVFVEITAQTDKIIVPVIGVTGACSSITVNTCINCVNTCN